MIIRKQITDSSLNLRIPSKLSCPESAQLCQDLGSRETLKCFSTISLDTMMKIIMATKPFKQLNHDGFHWWRDGTLDHDGLHRRNDGLYIVV